MIKAVDEIPMAPGAQRKSYRDQIRKDLQEAIDNGIKRFEFVGDYKYKYLGQYVREEADKLLRMAFHDVYSKHRAEFEKDKYLSWYNVKPKISYFNVTTVRTEKKDEPRVFCEIEDGTMEDTIYNAILQATADRAAIKRFKDDLKEGDVR